MARPRITLELLLTELRITDAYTIETLHGRGYLYYYDGRHMIDVDKKYANRIVERIYVRKEYRSQRPEVGKLEAGFGIVIRGVEDGTY